MKKGLYATIIILSMFILAQFIGLVVIESYSPVKFIDGEKVNISSPEVPFFGGETPKTNQDFIEVLFSFLLSFVVIIFFVLLLTKYKSEKFFRVWFFLVVSLALSVVFNLAFINLPYSKYIAVGFSMLLAYFKVYKRNLIIHNLTELIVYPGVAAAFVPLLSPLTIFILLILISIYDLWAVWKSGIMQKMAKYQINQLKIFSGFLVPNITSKERGKIKAISNKKKTKIKINMAVLGGGDVVFPIIASGVFYRNFGLGYSLSIIIGATLGLSYILFFGDKKKPYPAMPFITAGILLGLFFWSIFYFFI